MILQSGMTMGSQLAVGTFVFSVIALIANFSINAIGDDDPNGYRIAVGGFGICAIVPASIAVFLAIYGIAVDTVIPEIPLYVGVAVAFGLILTMTVVIYEILRGIESEERIITILLWIIPFILMIAGILRSIGD